MEHTIDATGKGLGRTASKAAILLMGKNKPDFTRNTVSGEKVHITNVSKIKIDSKKMTSVLHEKYSGYPGGLRYESIDQIVNKKGYAEIFRLAVYGMLPSNKLRSRIMKNLTITE